MLTQIFLQSHDGKLIRYRRKLRIETLTSQVPCSSVGFDLFEVLKVS